MSYLSYKRQSLGYKLFSQKSKSIISQIILHLITENTGKGTFQNSTGLFALIEMHI